MVHRSAAKKFPPPPRTGHVFNPKSELRKKGKTIAIRSKIAGNSTAAASQLQPHYYVLQPGLLFRSAGQLSDRP
jgi:hypothetical protein